MKNILNKIGMFLIKKLHLLLVITHFKKGEFITEESIQILKECVLDLKKCNQTLDRIDKGLEDYEMKLIEDDFNNKINYN